MPNHCTMFGTVNFPAKDSLNIEYTSIMSLAINLSRLVFFLHLSYVKRLVII